MTTTPIREPPPVCRSTASTPPARSHWNPTTSLLYTHALLRGDGRLAEGGPLVVDTGSTRGARREDKFVVREPGSEDRIWWGDVNQPSSARTASTALRGKVVSYLEQRDLYVVNAFAGADPGPPARRARRHRQPLARALRQDALHRSDRRRARRTRAAGARAARARGGGASPSEDGTRSSTFVVLHPVARRGADRRHVLRRRDQEVDLHGHERPPAARGRPADALLGERRRRRRVAIFFGLSGTGKTTLSADPERSLIGDDEHGWGDDGVFNIEGGCYAKVIRLSAEAEPEIYRTTRTFGTVLENVVVDERGVLDLDDDSKTENTRAAYKLEQIANALPEKRAGHPSSVVFLTADAFGILPPIARLTRDQALYWFLSGFTAKLAGTEIGVKEPQPTFSTCFGAPFLPQPPAVYARMLGEKLDEHGATVWLVNTGWTGGPYGEGERMPIAATRALLHAALSGELDGVEYRADEVFGFEVPVAVPGVDAEPARAALDVARPAGVRRARHASSPRCSARTSTSSPTRRRRRRGRPRSRG